jgi:putative ABC transport system permease protein
MRLARAATTPAGKRIQMRLEDAQSCGRMALANLLQDRRRLLAAIGGVAVALFLLLLQIAVLDGARLKVTQLFDDFDFDLAVVPDSYQFLLSFDTVDRVALSAAEATDGVAETFGLNAEPLAMTQSPSGKVAYIFLIGLDDPGNFLRDARIRAAMRNLQSPHDILIDTQSLPSVGPTAIGSRLAIRGENLSVAGQFKLGLFFYADGSGIVRNTDFARLAGRPPRSLTMGLVRLKPGADARAVQARLARTLPSGLLVLRRSELIAQERAYFISTRPVGIVLYISMLIAYLVGTVILVQVLSTDISNRLGEFATMKAMGFADIRVYGVGGAQAVLLALGGLVPALFFGALVLALIQYQTHLETFPGLGLVAAMILLALVLAAGAASIALRRVVRADPAELF